MAPVRGFWSPRTLSLIAVCAQSVVLAIVLHVSQSGLKPGEAHFKPSSAVLLTEVGKLVLSSLLALLQARRERAELRKPVHALPSPELYAKAEDVHKKDLYSDPFDAPTTDPSTAAPYANGRQNGHMRRRSSQQVPRNDLRLDVHIEHDDQAAAPLPQRSLSNFSWPASPRLPSPPEATRKESPPVQDTKAIRRRRQNLLAMLFEDVFRSDWWRMAVPAVLFAAQNNLIYFAARNLSVPVFQITFQVKTLMIALAAVVMLKRRLAISQWIALALLAVGVATMQLSALSAKATDSHGHARIDDSGSKNYVTGLASVLISCACASISSTYFELVIKRAPRPKEGYSLIDGSQPAPKPVSLWVRNIQLSFFSLIIGLCVVLVQANPVQVGANWLSLDLLDPLEHWYDPVVRSAEGFFVGFRSITWAAIGLQTVGGLLTAVALKYADNVVKGFALSLSIVFSFLLSVILFDFKLTVPAVFGGATVIGSTWLYEADPASLRAMFSKSKREGSDSGLPLLRRWHLIVLTVIGTTLVCALVPFRHASLTNAVWDLVASEASQIDLGHGPTIAVADVHVLNERLIAAASLCGEDVADVRRTQRLPFGYPRKAEKDFPYIPRETNEISLAAIIRTRLDDYSSLVDIKSADKPDFIFVPLVSNLYALGATCDREEMKKAINETTEFVKSLAKSVDDAAYPRVVLPITGRRSDFEYELFKAEHMEKFKDQVVVVAVENALKKVQDSMKFLLDVPYPTAFHLSSTTFDNVGGRRARKDRVGDFFLKRDRPFLLHYAGTKQAHADSSGDPFHGFALRDVLARQVSRYRSSGGTKHQVVFDEYDAAHKPDPIASREHMERSVFCLQPAGTSPTRRAFYEAVQLGCIPVLFRHKSYGRLFPSTPDVNDVSKYTVFIDENEVINGRGGSIIDRLEAIPEAEIRRKQKHLQKIAAKVQWAIPRRQLYLDGEIGQDGTSTGQETMNDAFALLVRELDAIKQGVWQAGRAIDHREGYKAKHFNS